MSIEPNILRLRRATLVKQDQLMYIAKLGQNRCIWENKAYPIHNRIIYWSVEHIPKSNDILVRAARVASAVSTLPTGNSWIHPCCVIIST